MGRAWQRVKFRSTPFHGSRRAFAVHSRPWQLRGRQRGPSRGDASPHFPGDAAGEKTLSWCAFLGFWGYGLEEGAFSVRRRPGSGLSPLRARAGAALVFFWADAHEGKGRTFLKKGAPKTFMLAALGALFRFYMTFSGLWPRWSNVFRKGLPAAWPWQMAKAKASAVSSGWGTFCNPSSRRVISWTWGFRALP